MGDYQVRFCERLAGETPACLLSEDERVANHKNQRHQRFVIDLLQRNSSLANRIKLM
jgi:hypothetical protein